MRVFNLKAYIALRFKFQQRSGTQPQTQKSKIPHHELTKDPLLGPGFVYLSSVKDECRPFLAHLRIYVAHRVHCIKFRVQSLVLGYKHWSTWGSHTTTVEAKLYIVIV